MTGIVITKERLMTFVAMTALAVLCVIYFFTYFNREIPTTKYEIKNNDRERRNFIESYGYTLSKNSPKKEKFRVPSDFSPTLMQFEKLQNEMGLSLLPFKGEVLTKYTYLLSNTKDTVYAEIYMFGRFVAAGCIVNPDLKNGYIKSF